MRCARTLVLALALALSGCAEAVPPPVPAAERPGLPGLGAALAPGPVLMSNRDIAEDFVELAFGTEAGTRLAGLVRFERPVRVALEGAGLEAFAEDLEALLARLRREARIDIGPGEPGAAPIRVTVAPRRQMAEIYPGAQCFVVPARYSWGEFVVSLDRATLPDWTTLSEMAAATVFIPSGATPAEVRECLQEEIAQTLGLPNDLFRLRDSAFNDDNVHTNLTRFDLLVLRVLYDPRLVSGMDERAAREAALSVLDEVNPEGRAIPRRGALRPAPEWERLISRLFAGGLNRAEQRLALRNALRLAQRFPGDDHRLAFTLSLLAVVEFAERPELAEGLLERALASLPARPEAEDLRRAVLRLNLAQVKLRLGKPADTLALAGAALPLLVAFDEAQRISLALDLRIAALRDLGRGAEAEALVPEADRWARHVFGTADPGFRPVRRLAPGPVPGPAGT